MHRTAHGLAQRALSGGPRAPADCPNTTCAGELLLDGERRLGKASAGEERRREDVVARLAGLRRVDWARSERSALRHCPLLPRPRLCCSAPLPRRLLSAA